MSMVQNFEVTSDKFNVFKIYISGNYAQNWMTKLYNYQFKVLASHNMYKCLGLRLISSSQNFILCVMNHFFLNHPTLFQHIEYFTILQTCTFPILFNNNDSRGVLKMPSQMCAHKIITYNQHIAQTLYYSLYCQHSEHPMPPKLRTSLKPEL
jgi:hypothetical protein